MFYYAGFLVAVYLVSHYKLQFNHSKSLQWNRAVLVGLLILLLMGLRHQTVAGDTIAYVSAFKDRPVEWTGFKDFFEQKEPLFYLTEMLCQKFFSDYTPYLIVTSLPLAIGFGRLLYEYSEDMYVSVLLFCGLGSMYFCMAGIRQAMAMGFTMIAYPYAKQRRLIPFLLWCLVAYEFHNSAIVFFFVYLFISWKPDWKMWVFTGIYVFLGLTKNPIVMTVAGFFTEKEYTTDAEGLNYTMFFIQLIFLLFCFVYSYLLRTKTKSEEYSQSNSFLVMSFIGVCFQALTPIKGEFFRVSSYFSTFLCFEVPITLGKMRVKEDRNTTRTIIILGLVAYIFIFGNARSYRIFL